MKSIILIALVCVLSTFQKPQRYNCGSKWESFWPTCRRVYKFYENGTTFHEAERICQREIAHLASIHTEQENEFIKFITRKGTPPSDPYDNNIWIGFFVDSNSGNWTWTDESPVDYTKWARGEPNKVEKFEHFAAIMPDVSYRNNPKYNSRGGEWNNLNSQNWARGFVCKKFFL
ncbi:unnamed protein product [Caenorhabditis brenneri]